MRKISRKFLSLLFRIRKTLHSFWFSLIGNKYMQRSYSQYGEDMIIRAVFARFPYDYRGFYVDIGANHPLKFSNTRFFYEQGWSGICIDPFPEFSKFYARLRPRDKFISAGVAESEKEMTYYMFAEPALNTFSEEIAKKQTAQVIRRKTVRVFPLNRILADNIPLGQKIDFLSIDVEGLDLQVLHSNDWTLFRPLVIVIEETSPVILTEVLELECTVYMKQQGYQAFARSPSALFFIDTYSKLYEGGGFLLKP